MVRDCLPLLHPNHCPSSPAAIGDCKGKNSSLVEAEATSVVRAIDINYSWLHPTKLYTCTGMKSMDESYYPRYFQALNLWLAANRRVLVRNML